MIRLTTFFKHASLKLQILISMISIGLYILSSHFLEKSYLKSKFPVDYFTQQTSFDAVKMKEWYSFMIKQDTMDIYIKTQFIDFAFIATVIITGFTLWTFIAHLHHEKSWFRRTGNLLSYSLPLAGLMDILENIVSFFMIAQPNDFSPILVIPYSSFASIKFGFWTIGITWLLLAIISLLITKIFLKRVLVASSFLLIGLGFANAQEQTNTSTKNGLIYFEADPLAFINKGYSIHLGYENWGFRFDLTKVKVDFPTRFEEAFYNTTAFDLVTKINGIKIDYLGKEEGKFKDAFVGLDINGQRLNFKHILTEEQTNLNTFNIGIRAGYKLNLIKGFYITPWAAIWKNVSQEKSFLVENDIVKTNKWDWITTFHFGYVIHL